MDDESTISALSRPGVGGWLAFYVFIRFVGVIMHLNVARDNRPVALQWAESACLLAGIISMVLILRKSRVALAFVAVDLGLHMIGLLYSVALNLRVSHAPRAGVYLFADVEGIALTIIWFMYFRLSRRVHETLGRNL